ncbi:hypothetical protein R3P38DRAFT_2761268 [Favolaschia claudopus]|uniref:Uncharacterized protein n=1 Tax=Favolaschia claudopus TaxID=2862362 RepID=A0AAW0E0F1_9AGAR
MITPARPHSECFQDGKVRTASLQQHENLYLDFIWLRCVDEFLLVEFVTCAFNSGTNEAHCGQKLVYCTNRSTSGVPQASYPFLPRTHLRGLGGNIVYIRHTYLKQAPATYPTAPKKSSNVHTLLYVSTIEKGLPVPPGILQGMNIGRFSKSVPRPSHLSMGE